MYPYGSCVDTKAVFRPNKAETAVHGRHSMGNRLRACVQVLAKPWGCVVGMAYYVI